MEKISIIIPVYNVQEYIGRCLDSVLCQTYSNFEVLCVVDGSPDGSGEICEQYSRLDGRIRVFHIENGGVGNARNYALDRIEGIWFCFIDADDWIEPDYLEILYRNAKKENCEISACAFQRDEAYRLGYEPANEATRIYASSEECIHAYICSSDSLYGMVWNKLYLTDIFGDIRFDTTVRVNEDCLYTQEIMEHGKRACVTSLKLYHWFYRKDSACHSSRMEADYSPAGVFDTLYRRNLALQDDEVNQTLKRNYVLYVVKILMYAQNARNGSGAQEAIRKCRDWSKEVWKTLSVKEKLKTYMMLYMPWVKPIALKISGK